MRSPIALSITVSLVAMSFAARVAADEAFVDPAVHEKLNTRGSARVIVDVRSNAPDAAAAMSRILSATGEKATALDSSAFAVRVGKEALDKLAQSKQVKGIYIDRPAFRSLRDTAEITAAVLQWKSGHEGKDVAIAVLDTGIDSEHPFLKSKIAGQACFSLHDPDRKVRSLCPKGFFAGESEVDLTDKAATGCAGRLPDCDHGTHVAGIVAGADLADPERQPAHLAGIARGANIFAVQVFSQIDDADECNGNAPCIGAYTSAQIRALEYIRSKVLYRKATDQGPNIVAVNMSLGFGKYPVACDRESAVARYITALRQEGVPTFVAAGNDSFVDGISMPACVSTAVAVGALDKPGVRSGALAYASYSNRVEDRLISLLAVGSDVRSSIPGGRYAAKWGTSMASPVAAGAYAILKSVFPQKDAEEILIAMTSTGIAVADPASNKTRPAVNVDRAYRKLAGLPFAPAAIAASAAEPAQTPLSPTQQTATRFIVEMPANKGTEGVASIQSISKSLEENLKVEWVKASKLTSDVVSITFSKPVSHEALSDQLKPVLGSDIILFVDRPAKAFTMPPVEKK